MSKCLASCSKSTGTDLFAIDTRGRSHQETQEGLTRGASGQPKVRYHFTYSLNPDALKLLRSPATAKHISQAFTVGGDFNMTTTLRPESAGHAVKCLLLSHAIPKFRHKLKPGKHQSKAAQNSTRLQKNVRELEDNLRTGISISKKQRLVDDVLVFLFSLYSRPSKQVCA